MAEWEVHEFPNGEVADDGLSVTVWARLASGEEHTLKMPYEQLDWLIQALLRLANGAYERQIQTGRLASPGDVTDPAMSVAGFRVLPHSKGEHALVQLTGRATASGPLGMGSFSLGTQQARDFGARLLEVADELAQRSRPLS